LRESYLLRASLVSVRIPSQIWKRKNAKCDFNKAYCIHIIVLFLKFMKKFKILEVNIKMAKEKRSELSNGLAKENI